MEIFGKILITDYLLLGTAIGLALSLVYAIIGGDNATVKHLKSLVGCGITCSYFIPFIAFFHHWMLGLILIFYSFRNLAMPSSIITGLGIGLFVDDVPDFINWIMDTIR